MNRTYATRHDVLGPDGKPKDGKKDPPKGPDRPAGAGPKPDVVVWHWKDERLQPMQEKQAAADRDFTYTAVYRVADKRFLRLADEKLRQVSLAPKHKYAIGRDTKPYEYRSYLTGKLLTDVYVIDLKTGEKKKAVEKLVSLFFGAAPVVPSVGASPFRAGPGCGARRGRRGPPGRRTARTPRPGAA